MQSRVRPASHARGWAVKKITRDLRGSHAIVRKILQSGETDLAQVGEHRELPKTGPWAEHVDRFLRANKGKTSWDRLQFVRIHEDGRTLEHDGHYGAVRRHAKTWAKARGPVGADTGLPLSWPPGGAHPFDPSRKIVLINGLTVTDTVAHVGPCHSRMLFARAGSARVRSRAILLGVMARCWLDVRCA